jgi:orotidine-5'-phosphate decarboxylase
VSTQQQVRLQDTCKIHQILVLWHNLSADSNSMTILEKLSHSQHKTSSRLCIGLDTDYTLLPEHLLEHVPKLPNNYGTQATSLPHLPLSTALFDALLFFNQAIIEATADLACAYKLNWAFYEQYGSTGIRLLERTLALLPSDAVIIADAKRADIGNTAERYARTLFSTFGCDAATVSPYMGRDSVEPFFAFDNKLTFVLALTSNPGSQDFQRLPVLTQPHACIGESQTSDTLHHIPSEPLFHHIVRSALRWKEEANAEHHHIGFVVGATHPNDLATLRTTAPHNVFLIPGVGAQGGNTEALLRANGTAPAIVNVSRAILYASRKKDFAEQARAAALRFRHQLALAR